MVPFCPKAKKAGCLCCTCENAKDFCCCAASHRSVYCPAFGIGIEPQQCPDYEERRTDHVEL